MDRPFSDMSPAPSADAFVRLASRWSRRESAACRASADPRSSGNKSVGSQLSSDPSTRGTASAGSMAQAVRSRFAAVSELATYEFGYGFVLGLARDVGVIRKDGVSPNVARHDGACHDGALKRGPMSLIDT